MGDCLKVPLRSKHVSRDVQGTTGVVADNVAALQVLAISTGPAIQVMHLINDDRRQRHDEQRTRMDLALLHIGYYMHAVCSSVGAHHDRRSTRDNVHAANMCWHQQMAHVSAGFKNFITTATFSSRQQITQIPLTGLHCIKVSILPRKLQTSASRIAGTGSCGKTQS